MRVFVCSRDDTMTRIDCDDASTEPRRVLEGLPVRCVAADGDRVIVGTQGAGALLSSDGGRRWERMELPERDVFSVAIGRADGTLYAGTEPSRLFAGRDGGEWTELEALQDIPSRGSWSFPPRPWTHHVRWIAPDPHRRERLLVGIELGGVMLSEDGGASFSDHRPGAKRDARVRTSSGALGRASVRAPLPLARGRLARAARARRVNAVHARRPSRRARLRHGRRAAAPQARSRRHLAAARGDGADHRHGPRGVTVTRPYAPLKELSAGRGARHLMECE
jgi:hypothetical protein